MVSSTQENILEMKNFQTTIFCVCVFVPLETSKTGCCITTLLIQSLIASPNKLHKLLFKAIRCMVHKKKPLELFIGNTLKAVHAHCTSSYPKQGESCLLFEVRWNILEGYALKDTLHITSTIVAIAFFHEWDTDFYVNGLEIFT